MMCKKSSPHLDSPLSSRHRARTFADDRILLHVQLGPFVRRSSLDGLSTILTDIAS